MHNQKSVEEKETWEVLWDNEIQTDHQISARRPNLMIVNKKENLPNSVDFVIPADHRILSKESEKRYKYLYFARELKKTMEHESDGEANCNRCPRNNPQRIG